MSVCVISYTLSYDSSPPSSKGKYGGWPLRMEHFLGVFPKSHSLLTPPPSLSPLNLSTLSLMHVFSVSSFSLAHTRGLLSLYFHLSHPPPFRTIYLSLSICPIPFHIYPSLLSLSLLPLMSFSSFSLSLPLPLALSLSRSRSKSPLRG